MRKPTEKKPDPEIELRPDGWQQFELAVDAAVKSGPKHRVMPKAPKRTTGKGRARVGKGRAPSGG